MKWIRCSAITPFYRTRVPSARSLLATLTNASAENRREERLQSYTLPKLRRIDERGDRPIAQHGAHLFCQLLSRWYARGAMILPAPQRFGPWAEVFGHPILVPALLDRLLPHRVVVNLTGDSDRLSAHQQAGLLSKPAPPLAV